MPEIFDVVIVGSGAGGSMMAYTLTQAGARVAVVEAGGHNIDHDIRHHQWLGSYLTVTRIKATRSIPFG